MAAVHAWVKLGGKVFMTAGGGMLNEGNLTNAVHCSGFGQNCVVPDSKLLLP